MKHQTERKNIFALPVVITFILVCIIALSGGRLHAEEKMSLTLSSTAFSYGGEIPLEHTCQGDDISPALRWDGIPGNTRSLVLIVDDPDAPDPDAPKMTWVHWVLYNMPPDTTALPQGTTSKDLPPGTREGINDWKKTGYGGPCPPIGRHRYFFKLYALDTQLELGSRATKTQVEAAMRGHIIEKCELIGTYKKH